MSDNEYEKVQFIYNVIREQISKEDNLLNQRHRLGTLVQLFMLSIASVLISYLFNLEAQPKEYILSIFSIIFFILSVIGILHCKIYKDSINSAHKQIKYLSSLYWENFNKFKLYSFSRLFGLNFHYNESINYIRPSDENLFFHQLNYSRETPMIYEKIVDIPNYSIDIINFLLFLWLLLCIISVILCFVMMLKIFFPCCFLLNISTFS